MVWIREEQASRVAWSDGKSAGRGGFARGADVPDGIAVVAAGSGLCPNRSMGHVYQYIICQGWSQITCVYRRTSTGRGGNPLAP